MTLIDIGVGNTNFVLFPIKTSKSKVNEFFKLFIVCNDTALSYESQGIKTGGF